VNRIPNSPTGGRRARRMASTRQELLLAGRKLFSDKGLYESRVEEITETADVGKGTLYRYFRNKEALIVAVVETGFDDLRRAVEERVARATGLDRAIEAIAEAHLRFFADNHDLMRIFHQARGMLKFDRPEWQPLRTSLDGHLRFLTAELRRFGNGARLSPARGRDLAILLFGGLSGTLSVGIAVDPDVSIASMSPLVVTATKGMLRNLTRPNGRRQSGGTSTGSRRRDGRRVGQAE